MKILFPEKLHELDKDYRYKIIYGGRGSSKSWTVARKLLIRATQEKLNILCTRQLQNSISDSVHKLLVEQINEMGLSEYFTITRGSITCVNGSKFIFKGIQHNVAEIKSTEGIDICWIEEAELLTAISWNIIAPTIRKKKSEIWVTFNTRFKHDFLYKTFILNKPPPRTLVIKINYNDNPWFPDVLREQMEHMRKTDVEMYLHIWLGELKQVADGAIFGKQVARCRFDERIQSIPIQSNSVVDVYFDLGKSDETAMWFVQRVGKEVHLIDYYEATLEDVDHYVRYLKSLDYNYGTFYLPHDAAHNRLGMTRNIQEQFEDGGIKPIIVVEKIQHKATAIELARELFANCYFHQNADERGIRVELGLDHLSAYRYQYNNRNEVYQANPLHDKHSNGADAFMAIAQAQAQSTGAFTQYADWSQSINN